MFRWILNKFGYDVMYVHTWGSWPHRYSDADWAMNRPIHRRMSVAPPGSKRVIYKK